ncbi:MAG: hypothetical protein GX443_05970 [Deltaproteobacteria bacterium]|nr:hypothetical protein [Deltaproteobacteria bacterium]
MKILYSSDTHVHPAHFQKLLTAAHSLKPAAIIVGGDINPDWKRGGIAHSIEPHRSWIRDRLLPAVADFRRTHPETQILLDLGNDDIAAARELLIPHDGKELHLLHRRVVPVGEEFAVAGYMTVNPTPFAIKDWEKPDCHERPGLKDAGVSRTGYCTRSGAPAPVELDFSSGTMEEDLEALARSIAENVPLHRKLVFVSHAPPRDTALDLTQHGLHVGSLAVRRFLESRGKECRIAVSLHGHIHESPWQSGSVWEAVAGIPCFNVGQTNRHLRALFFSSEDPLESARLIVVEPSGEVGVRDRGVWF